jgi:hypothetical protein
MDPPQQPIVQPTPSAYPASEPNPPLPPRPQPSDESNFLQAPPPYDPYGRPPQRKSLEFGDDANSPVHYMRDPHKLVAYLIPFPKPLAPHANEIPDRFMIYTPPPPPLSSPKEGEKEDRLRKVQRKWQQEVREAKLSDAKITSWKGIKSRATRGIHTAMGYTTSSNLDFLNRVPGSSKPKDQKDQPTSDDDDLYSDPTTKKTVGLEEMILIYPTTMPGSEQQIREEFVSSMLRSKSKAQKDAIIATGLLPVSAAIDILATVIWPFGGLLEIDGIWLYSSFRGAKTARSVTKRLHSSSPSDDKHDSHKIKLSFTPSPRLEMLRKYLVGECHKRDPKLFASEGPPPIESDVLEAIGWSPSQTGGEMRNWEDEQWEIAEVKDDLKTTMNKAAREWDKWCRAFEKDPEKALKK